jgi:uncharacterized protein YdeI (YjbR/CyaY-like superfamily)
VAELERIHPATRREWRDWLEAHHDTSAGAWVTQWRSVTGRPRVEYPDLVEEALCFGWIDGQRKTIDDERTVIRMTPRRPRSAWARSNKERVARLVTGGQMTDAGLRVIERAKADGSWDVLDDVDALIIPEDFEAALATDEPARRHFAAFPPSAKRAILYWIKSAKRPDTRQRRIAETVRLAAQNKRGPGQTSG